MLGLAAAASAAGFPLPLTQQNSLILNVKINPQVVDWASIYHELVLVFEIVSGEKLIPGGAWDALIQMHAKSVYDLICFGEKTIFNFVSPDAPHAQKWRELLGEEPKIQHKAVA